MSKAHIRESNNNAMVEELKQELENHTIIDKLWNEIGVLENNGSKLQKDNNKVKKDFDEYNVRYPENVDS